MEEEVRNLTQDDVLDLIHEFPVQPTRSKVLITVNTAEPDENNIDITGNSFDEVQFVISSGSHAIEIKPGQKVILDVQKMMPANAGGQIEIDPIEINGRIYAFVNESVIKAIDNR